MRQKIRFNKMMIYFILGIIVIIFRDELKKYLYLVVGIPMLILAIEGLTYELFTKSYLRKHNHLGQEILSFILALIIILFLDNDLNLICIIWGIIAILSSTKEFSETIYDLALKRSFLLILKLFEAILQTIFAIMLMIEPEEHIDFHLILLGIEMELEASRILMSFIYNLKKKNKIEVKEE